MDVGLTGFKNKSPRESFVCDICVFVVHVFYSSYQVFVSVVSARVFILTLQFVVHTHRREDPYRLLLNVTELCTAGSV